jgi:flagellar basal-body rod protein FlgB
MRQLATCLGIWHAGCTKQEAAALGRKNLTQKGNAMFANLFDSTSIPVLQEVVKFTQARHNVLAGNIANVDTPGYKVHEISVDDFQSRLQEAIQERRQSAALGTISPGEAGFKGKSPIGEVANNSKTILRHDENNVNLEEQVTEMVKNQMEHNMALALMTNQFQLLETAISEKV